MRRTELVSCWVGDTPVRLDLQASIAELEVYSDDGTGVLRRVTIAYRPSWKFRDYPALEADEVVSWRNAQWAIWDRRQTCPHQYGHLFSPRCGELLKEKT